MKDILLNIGSIVEVECNGPKSYMIVGKRAINFSNMVAWDYYSVPYPERHIRDKQGNDHNGFYFNHPDIDKIIYKCEVDIPEKESEGASVGLFKNRKD